MIATIAAILLSAASAAAQQPDTGRTIVVTGQRIRDFHRAVETCLARNCPTDQDVDATMALAEALFLEGEYEDARRAIRASIARNRRHSARYPEPVSDLYRGNARMSRHMGHDRDAALSTRDVLRVLREAIPTEDHRHFGARLEIAQSLVAFGRYEEAATELATLAERARAAGREDVVDMAELRRLWIGYLVDPSGRATRRLAALAEGRQAGSPLLVHGARTLMIRIYSERRETAKADALIARLGGTSRQRQLLFNPPYELIQREDMGATRARQAEIQANTQGQGAQPLLTSNMQDRVLFDADDEWMDIGFWISPDGRVEDLEIVRRGEGAGGWEAPLLGSIRGRRYSAIDGEERTYRLERYTYTSELRTNATGTRTVQRSPRARVEYMDLTSPTGTN